jgi:dihydropteroate synthase
MELRLGSHAFSIGDFVIYVADAETPPALAQIAEVAPDPQHVTRISMEYPGMLIAVAPADPSIARACVEAGAALLVGDRLAGVAAATGAGLVCVDPVSAISQGVRPDGLLVEARSAADIEALVRTGHTVIVTPGCTPPAAGSEGSPAIEVRDTPAAMSPDPAALAVSAVYGWLGAQVFRVPVRDLAATRETLNMIASIKGRRPPSVSRRGLV